MIRYLGAFEDFDPLTDSLPESFENSLVGYIRQHACHLMPDNYSIVDLNAMLEVLFQVNKMGTRSSIRYFSKNRGSFDSSGLMTSSPLRIQLVLMEEGPATDLKKQGYTPSQLLATFALGCISDYVSLNTGGIEITEGFDAESGDPVKNILKIEHGETDVDKGFLFAQILPEAMEALGIARTMDVAKARDKKISKGVSVYKLKNYHPLKLAIVTHYNALDRGRSITSVAPEIYEALDESLKLIFTTDDPVHQIKKWLGQYRAGNLPGQDMLPPYLE